MENRKTALRPLLSAPSPQPLPLSSYPLSLTSYPLPLCSSDPEHPTVIHALPHTLHLLINREAGALVVRAHHKHLSHAITVKVEHIDQATHFGSLFISFLVPGQSALVLPQLRFHRFGN